ncbi:hypothetical protein RRG08_010889 [Elysia crispata]|uniref:Uncharacterized protein n=1 Tax=Elysia crispata TaxID=231223 RepID=A0AAE0YW45_9GAST|nr:hypothetical protein RRG08_010889 [Elysia crispata]
MEGRPSCFQMPSSVLSVPGELCLDLAQDGPSWPPRHRFSPAGGMSDILLTDPRDIAASGQCLVDTRNFVQTAYQDQMSDEKIYETKNT